MTGRKVLLAAAAAAALACAGASQAADAARPWMNARLDPDRRADLILGQMSLDEQVSLLHGVFPLMMPKPPAGAIRAAGFVPGQARLGIPALTESDASLGVANAGRGDKDDAAALPSGLGLAAGWDVDGAYAAGAMIGKEARQKGFNVLLAGGVNLVREPRNGRAFEYLGEDPLLAGMLDGASIRGIQSNHIVSTIKHFAANDQETGRMVLDVKADEAALRESDLLAFQLAIESGQPGSVMCAYNRVGGTYACENPHLLTDVLRKDWGWKGWVMSDWGAVHSVQAATAGLDQESGEQLDRQVFFGAPLKAAVEKGEIPAGQVRTMAHRVLRSMFAHGLFDHPVTAGGLDTAADAAVAQAAAERGVVLLKNDGGLLPLAAGARRIAVIGGHADVGVPSGGGSSQVIPIGSVRFAPPKGAPAWTGGVFYHPASPLKAIQARAKGVVTFDDGGNPAAAAAAARDADVAIVFANQWSTEAMDNALSLPDGQDALIEAVAAANPRTIVVLQTGGPVLTPWAARAGAILEAWYGGSRGGEAIARVLFGEVGPQGRLPVTFPAAERQLPNPELPGGKDAAPEGAPTGDQPKAFPVRFHEGSDVGYRWFARTGEAAQFAFGHGLTYTTFRYGGLEVTGGRTLTASFTVTNTGARAGVDTPQVYLAEGPRRRQQRLIGWSKVALRPGETREVRIAADPRLLADWDEPAHGWRVDGGAYRVFVGASAASPLMEGRAHVQAQRLRP